MIMHFPDGSSLITYNNTKPGAIWHVFWEQKGEKGLIKLHLTSLPSTRSWRRKTGIKGWGDRESAIKVIEEFEQRY